jgi:uncharacterized protein (DUF1501 family)
MDGGASAHLSQCNPRLSGGVTMLNRRHFLSTSLAAASLPAFSVKWAKAATPVDHSLVVVFLRGGMDVLNLLAPADDVSYLQSRPSNLRVATSGEGKGLLLGNMGKHGDFLLHAEAQALHRLWQKKTLAIIPAAGLANPTRSHFQAMELMEQGLAARAASSPQDGWLTRVAATYGEHVPGSILSIGGALPQSLSLCEEALQVGDVWDIDWVPSRSFGEALYALHAGDSPLDRASRQALDATGRLAQKLYRNDKKEPVVRDAPRGVAYPDHDFGRQLHFLAEMMQQNPDIHIASADLDGWDMHDSQPDRFPSLVRVLSQGLEAFHDHLETLKRPTTVVVMSEFGRRVKANESRGTDHGHGGVMMVLDAQAKGGKFHGTWPGLAPELLDQGMDLAITTDYRDVLATVLQRQGAEAAVTAAFPGHQVNAVDGLFAV